VFSPAAALARRITDFALYAARMGQLPTLWTVEACPSLPSLLAGVDPAMSKFKQAEIVRSSMLNKYFQHSEF
jgi:hypothetical protein